MGILLLTLSFLAKKGSLEADIGDSRIYLIAVYYALVTVATVGFGDITPTNDFERICVCVFVVFGVLVYTNSISLFSKIAQMST